MTDVLTDRLALSGDTHLRIAETSCRLQCTHPEFAKTLSRWVRKRGTREPSYDFTLRVQVSDAEDTLEPVHFRGAGHLVIAQYGKNVFVFDLLRRTVEARISKAIALECELWADRFLPLMLGVLGASVGVLPLHAACVVKGAKGILIAGASMAGKSTLSVALAQAGFALLSDDWTYIRMRGKALTACGMEVAVKLLPDAAEHFPELRPLSPAPTSNGEVAYEVHANELFSVPVAARCKPTAFVFLERTAEGWPEILPASHSFVQEYVRNSVERLPKELADVSAAREHTIATLSALPSWIYRYSGPPKTGADYLARFFESATR